MPIRRRRRRRRQSSGPSSSVIRNFPSHFSCWLKFSSLTTKVKRRKKKTAIKIPPVHSPLKIRKRQEPRVEPTGVRSLRNNSGCWFVPRVCIFGNIRKKEEEEDEKRVVKLTKTMAIFFFFSWSCWGFYFGASSHSFSTLLHLWMRLLVQHYSRLQSIDNILHSVVFSLSL